MRHAATYLAFSAFSTLTALNAQDWVLASPATSPAGATFPRSAFDVARARTVVFGGWNAPTGSIVFQDTWEYDGTNWLQRSPATVPDERDSHVMAYDSVRARTVMFGGWDFAFNMLGETWEWDGNDWSNRTPANAPSARLLSAMTFDSARNVIVLFGGRDQAGRQNDTWEYDGIDWTQATPATSPGVREGHSMAYDAARATTVMFGGQAGALQNDTWEYDGGNWTQITTDGAPSPRTDSFMVFDLQRSRCVLFGGSNGVLDLDETWEYDGRGWRELVTGARPQGSSAMSASYDVIRGQTVVFGGYDGAGAIGDTWELGGNAATYRTFGTGCDGSNLLPPRIVPGAMPTIGTTTDVTIVDLPNTGGAAFVTAGFSDTVSGGAPLPIDLTGIGLTGCRGYTSTDVSVLVTHISGTANWSLAIPANPSLSGLTIFLQALSIDPAVTRPLPGATSNAAEMNVR